MSHGKNGYEYLYTITRLYNIYYRILKIPICRYNIIEIVSFFLILKLICWVIQNNLYDIIY